MNKTCESLFGRASRYQDSAEVVIYDDVVAIVQTVLWNSDYLVSFSSTNVWNLVNDITAAVGRIDFTNSPMSSNEGKHRQKVPFSRVKELTGPRSDWRTSQPIRLR